MAIFLCHLYVRCKKSYFIFCLCPAVLWAWSLSMLKAGAVNRLPKNFSQVSQIFTTQLKRNEGHKMQQHRPTMKWKYSYILQCCCRVPKEWHLINGRIRWGGGVGSVLHTFIETQISHGLLSNCLKLPLFIGCKW